MYVLTRVRKLYERRRQGYFVSTLGILSRNKFTVGVLAVLLLIVMCAAFPMYVSPYDPYEMQSNDRFLSPTWKHLLGTDMFGRDTLSRMIWGSRISLYVAGVSVIIALLAGAIVGLVAGYRGGLLDEFIMRIVDGLLVFPDVFLGLIVIALLGTGMEKVMLAMGIMFTPAFARVARGVTLSEREGICSCLQISWRHRQTHHPSRGSSKLHRPSHDSSNAVLGVWRSLRVLLQLLGIGS